MLAQEGQDPLTPTSIYQLCQDINNIEMLFMLANLENLQTSNVPSAHFMLAQEG